MRAVKDYLTTPWRETNKEQRGESEGFVWPTIDLKVRNVYNALAYLMLSSKPPMLMNGLPHPSLLVQPDCFKPPVLCNEEGAKVLSVTWQAKSNLVSCTAVISAEMTIRPKKALGGRSETWFQMQSCLIL